MSTRIQKKTGFVDLLSKNESHIKASIPPKMVSAGLTPSFVIRSIQGAINNSDQGRRRQVPQGGVVWGFALPR